MKRILSALFVAAAQAQNTTQNITTEAATTTGFSTLPLESPTTTSPNLLSDEEQRDAAMLEKIVGPKAAVAVEITGAISVAGLLIATAVTKAMECEKNKAEVAKTLAETRKTSAEAITIEIDNASKTASRITPSHTHLGSITSNGDYMPVNPNEELSEVEEVERSVDNLREILHSGTPADSTANSPTESKSAQRSSPLSRLSVLSGSTVIDSQQQEEKASTPGMDSV